METKYLISLSPEEHQILVVLLESKCMEVQMWILGTRQRARDKEYSLLVKLKERISTAKGGE